MTFRRALIAVVVIELLSASLALTFYGLTVEGLQAITRYSGRVSLFIFSLVFLFHLHPFVRLNRMLSEKYFLVFAIAHGIHLVQLLSFLVVSGSKPILYRLAGGMLAYAMIFVMPWIETRHTRGKIAERRFNQIALVYLYYVWFIFFMTYLPRVRGTLPGVGGNYIEFVALLGWVSLLLGIKLSQLLSRRSVTSNR